MKKEFMKMFVGDHLQDDIWNDLELIEDNDQRKSVVAYFNDVEVEYSVDNDVKFKMKFENMQVKFTYSHTNDVKLCFLNVTDKEQTKCYYSLYTLLDNVKIKKASFD